MAAATGSDETFLNEDGEVQIKKGNLHSKRHDMHRLLQKIADDPKSYYKFMKKTDAIR